MVRASIDETANPIAHWPVRPHRHATDPDRADFDAATGTLAEVATMRARARAVELASARTSEFTLARSALRATARTDFPRVRIPYARVTAHPHSPMQTLAQEIVRRVDARFGSVPRTASLADAGAQTGHDEERTFPTMTRKWPEA